MVLMPRQTFQAKNLVSRNNRALSEFSYWILKDIFHKFYLFPSWTVLYITSSDRNKWRKELRILREPHVETRLIQRTPWIYCCGEVRPNMLILNSLANEARVCNIYSCLSDDQKTLSFLGYFVFCFLSSRDVFFFVLVFFITFCFCYFYILQ